MYYVICLILLLNYQTIVPTKYIIKLKYYYIFDPTNCKHFLIICLTTVLIQQLFCHINLRIWPSVFRQETAKTVVTILSSVCRG